MRGKLVARDTLVDRTVEVIREGLREGRWKNKMPGQGKLARELGVSRKTLSAATVRLVAEGVISPTGSRKAPIVALAATALPVTKNRSLRVAFLTLQPLEAFPPENRQELHTILTNIRGAGHTDIPVTFPSGKDPHKTGHLAKLVADIRADAWIVVNGTEEMLRWFSEQDVPSLAFGGRAKELPIATLGMTLSDFVPLVMRKLTALGHRRIVIISPHAWRAPTPGQIILEFRKELESAGVRPGEYHTPDWKETPKGLDELMNELFRLTPPTALLCWAPNTTFGVLGWLARHGLSVPGDVSILSLWDDRAYDWFAPGLHIAYAKNNDARILRLVMEWVAEVAAGETTKDKRLVSPLLEEGTSIGRAKRA